MGRRAFHLNFANEEMRTAGVAHNQLSFLARLFTGDFVSACVRVRFGLRILIFRLIIRLDLINYFSVNEAKW